MIEFLHPDAQGLSGIALLKGTDRMDGRYYCFADFEFTCGYMITRNKSEVLSVGLVICDSDFELCETFYETACPNRYPKLTKQCRSLTKLDQDEIYRSPDSDAVMAQAVALLKKYGIDRICVWGNFDAPGLEADILQHERLRRGAGNVRKIRSLVTDIQAELTRKMELPQAVNIKELADAFGYVPEQGTFHNALNDAMALYSVCKAVYTTDFASCPGFAKMKQQRVEKIEAEKKAAEERRRLIAQKYPLSEEEKAFIEQLNSTHEGRRVQDYMRLRMRIINAFEAHPEEEQFYALTFRSYKDEYKVLTGKQYSKKTYPGNVEVRLVERLPKDDKVYIRIQRNL